MKDDPANKSKKTLTLRRPAAAEPASDKTGNKPVRKVGARAHQHARLAAEQKKVTPAPPTANRQPDKAHRSPAMDEVFKAFAPCPRGLENVLATELGALGFSGVAVGRAGCHFRGSWTDIQRANLHSRIATRILVQLGHRPVRSEADIATLAMDIEWERWFGAEKTLRVDTSAIHSPFKSLQYCNLVAKDGICDRLRAREGARPSIDTVRPDARVHLFLSDTEATLYLDTSGESLFKRGWRLDKGEAPIRENLAAGLLRLSGWTPDTPLVDPFCGSGTILIEAAWMALNIPPGINRPFGFERLRHHDRQAWQGLRQQATASIKAQTDTPLVGCDIAAQAIEAALQNAVRAGLQPDALRLEVGSALALKAPAPLGMIVTNPPYGERLTQEDALMHDWAAHLKREFPGWSVNVISADMKLPGAMRLKATRRTPVFNGAIDCRLYEFDVLAASDRLGSTVGILQQTP